MIKPIKRSYSTLLPVFLFLLFISCFAGYTRSDILYTPKKTDSTKLTAAPMATPLKPADTAIAVVPTDTDSACWDTSLSGTDSAISAMAQEVRSQESLDSLVKHGDFNVDTLAWDSIKINPGTFESGKWTDTAHLVLSDTSLQKRFVQPFCGEITSNFGLRHCLWHYGIDIQLRIGDTVVSAFDGIIRIIAYDRRGYGHVIVIRHADGLETLYGHLSKTLVTTRQRVKAGEVIGLGGNTGHSTGSHLHFETRYYGEAFDPNYCIDFEKCALRSDTLVLSKANFEYLVELRKEQWCVVQKGNNLGIIARRYHTSIANLCALNHITRKTILSIGRKLRYR
jgi:hypothetical protein